MMEKETGALVGASLGFHGNRLWLAAEGAPGVVGAVRHLRKWNAQDVVVMLRFNWSR